MAGALRFARESHQRERAEERTRLILVSTSEGFFCVGSRRDATRPVSTGPSGS